jgi:hypothetical protein
MAMISKKQLLAFYQEVGKTIADWLSSLECPNCKDQSDLDWMLKTASEGKPQLICRSCGKRFYIKNLRFKRQIVQPDRFALKHNWEQRKELPSTVS